MWAQHEASTQNAHAFQSFLQPASLNTTAPQCRHFLVHDQQNENHFANVNRNISSSLLEPSTPPWEEVGFGPSLFP